MIKPCVECAAPFEDRDEHWRTMCMPCYIESRRASANPFSRRTRPGKEPLPKEWHEFLKEIPSLMRMCHPDYNDNSEASVRLTQWLIEVKKKHVTR